MNKIAKIMISSVLFGVILFSQSCVHFGAKNKTPTEVFKNSLYREFPIPLDDSTLDRFNIFWCINQPDWVLDTPECALVRKCINDSECGPGETMNRQVVWPPETTTDFQ